MSEALPEDNITLRCRCCGTPWAQVVNGCLVVESTHHGKLHVNQVAIVELLALIFPAMGITTQSSQRAKSAP